MKSVTHSKDPEAVVWLCLVICLSIGTPTGLQAALGARSSLPLQDDSGGKLRLHANLVSDQPVFSIALSPDGRQYLAVQDTSATLYDVESGAPLARFRHRQQVTSAAVSPDGSRIVTGSMDKTAILWDARTGKAIRRLEPPEGINHALFGYRRADFEPRDSHRAERMAVLGSGAGPRAVRRGVAGHRSIGRVAGASPAPRLQAGYRTFSRADSSTTVTLRFQAEVRSGVTLDGIAREKLMVSPKESTGRPPAVVGEERR